jgi:SHS2 domain-containing protein
MGASSHTVEHVGEWRVELRADTMPEIFQELARVIAAVAGESSAAPGPWEAIDVESRDRDALLVDWANELVSRSEIASRAYDDLRDVVIHENGRPHIEARVRGRPVVAWRSPLKAATYHGAHLTGDADGWRATVLFDV